MGTTATARGLAEPRERRPERGRPATDQREPQEHYLPFLLLFFRDAGCFL